MPRWYSAGTGSAHSHHKKGHIRAYLGIVLYSDQLPAKSLHSSIIQSKPAFIPQVAYHVLLLYSTAYVSSVAALTTTKYPGYHVQDHHKHT